MSDDRYRSTRLQTNPEDGVNKTSVGLASWSILLLLFSREAGFALHIATEYSFTISLGYVNLNQSVLG